MGNMHKSQSVHVREIKAIDQFSSIYEGMIAAYHAPSSICGYVVLAMADYLSKVEGNPEEAIKWIN